MPRPEFRRVAEAIRTCHTKDRTLILKRIAKDVGVPENRARIYFKRAYGQTFTEFVKGRRESFIQQNQRLTNEEICSELGITNSTLSYLIRDLKAKGLLEISRRKVSIDRGLKFSNKPIALGIMRMLRWLPLNRGLSAPSLAHFLAMTRPNVTTTINMLLGAKFVKKGVKVGQRQYYTITPQGRSWLNQMEEIRIERDVVTLKDPRRIKSIVERKEKELNSFLKLKVFLESEEVPLDADTLGKIIVAKRREIKRLEAMAQ